MEGIGKKVKQRALGRLEFGVRAAEQAWQGRDEPTCGLQGRQNESRALSIRDMRTGCGPGKVCTACGAGRTKQGLKYSRTRAQAEEKGRFGGVCKAGS